MICMCLWGRTLLHLLLVKRKMEILFDCQTDVPDVSLPFTASAHPVSSISYVASKLSYKTKFGSFSSDQSITDQGHLFYLLYCFGSCLSWLSLDLPNSLWLLFERSWKEVSTTYICSTLSSLVCAKTSSQLAVIYIKLLESRLKTPDMLMLFIMFLISIKETIVFVFVPNK